MRLSSRAKISFTSIHYSAVTPRPVAFVSTCSAAGINNLSPFSYFSVVSHDPPIVSIGICANRDGSKKDTLVNIEVNSSNSTRNCFSSKLNKIVNFYILKETGDFVVNIVSDWMVEAASHTCGAWPPEVDEFQKSGLTPLSSEIVGPPRVEESAFHMECKLFSKTEIFNDKGAHTTTIVLGRVARFHVKEQLLEKNAAGMPVINTLGLQPCGRLGGDTWALLGDTFDIKRPVV